MGRLLRPFLAALIPALALCAGARAARLSVVVDGPRPTSQKVVAALEKGLASGNTIEVYDLRSVDMSNPILRGRFLARVSAADFVVPVGDTASVLVSRELEDIRAFFISAAGLSGAYLGQKHVSGVLSYSPEQTVRVAKALLPGIRSVGVFYTPGYESVALGMSAAAERAGVALTAYRVKSLQEMGPLARMAAARHDLIWIAGDPLLTQDLIFSYLLQETLRLKKPLAVPLPSLVEKGALFSTVPDDDKLAREASEAMGRALSPAGLGEQRLLLAPADGFVVINRQLAGKWEIRIPASLRTLERVEP